MDVARLTLRFGLIALGLAIAAFFGMLLLIGDCGPDCLARGERAPVFVLLGLGVFLAALGATLGKGALRATGLAMLAGGVLATAGTLWTVADGARGAMAWVSLAVGAGCAAVGAWLAFWRPH